MRWLRQFHVIWWGLPWWSEFRDHALIVHWVGWRWGLHRPEPDSAWGKVFAWELDLGPVEIRRWTDEAMARAHR